MGFRCSAKIFSLTKYEGVFSEIRLPQALKVGKFVTMDSVPTPKEIYKLKSNVFEANIKSAFLDIKEEKDFSDVTIACEDQQVEAHRVILAANSNFFSRILKKNKHSHPLIYLKGIKFSVLEDLINFIYLGEVNVHQDNLKEFLNASEEVEVKGLYTPGKNPVGNSISSQQHHTAAPPPTPHPVAASPLQSSAQVQTQSHIQTGSNSDPDVRANVQNNNDFGKEVLVKKEPDLSQFQEDYYVAAEGLQVAAEGQAGQHPGVDSVAAEEQEGQNPVLAMKEQCSQIWPNIMRLNLTFGVFDYFEKHNT